MAEVTREMILDYMQAREGVVKNVDLVRHFRKYLQVSDPRAKDQARDQFKARVNDIAYIKADNKGEKYLYLKTELNQSSTAQDSTHSVVSKRDSTHSLVSKRDSTHSLLSKRDSAYSILSSTSGSNSGPNYGRSPRHNTRTPPRDSPGHSSTTSSTQHTSSSTSRQSGLTSNKPPPTSSSKEPSSSTTTAPLSSLGDSLLGDTAFSSFFSGGTGLGATTTTSTTTSSSTADTGGGDSSFASDIFGTIGSFWGDSGLTSTTSASDQRKKDSSPPPLQSSSSVTALPATSNQSTSIRGGVRSQIAGSVSTDVSLKSYKRISTPPLTTTSTRSPSPPPPSRVTAKPPSHPSSSNKPHSSPPRRRPPSPPPPSSKPPPSPPRRNPSYTTTHSYTATNSNTGPSISSGSVFSPPPPLLSSSDDGGDLLAQMTSQLGSFGGELGSLLDTFGDSMSTTTTNTLTPATRDTTSPLEKSTTSSDRSSSSVTLLAGGNSKPSTQNRNSPAKSSVGGDSTFSSIRSTPPPAPGSPMRVPRRTAPIMDSSTHHSILTQRRGSFDGGGYHHHQQHHDISPRIEVHRVDSQRSDSPSNGVATTLHSVGGGAGDVRSRASSSGLPPLPPSAILGANTDPRRALASLSNGGLGVALRQQDRTARDSRVQSSLRRSKNLENKATNLDTLTRASIMMTPPSVRRVPGAGCGVGMYAPSSSGEDLSQYQGDGDQDGSLSAPSEDYELDPLEKDWMLACASADMDELHSIMIRDSTLINRKDFLHGYTALHWAAKLGRCDIMSTLVLNGAFPNIKSNGGFTPLHLACQGGYDNAIAMLVRDHGANVNARDNSGRKPIDMLNYSCPDHIRALLTNKLTRSRAVHNSSEHLPSFSQPRNRLGSLSNMWTSMPNSLESSDDKTKKRMSPKQNKRTFSFRNKHKINSPHDKRDRPRSHIPETYDA